MSLLRRIVGYLMLFAGAAAAIVLIVGGWATHRLSAQVHTVQVNEHVLAEPEQTLPGTFLAAINAPPADTPMNLLVLGSDTREGQPGVYGNTDTIDSARSDTAILLHLSADRSTATAVSIPRDLWVTHPDCELPDGTIIPSYTDRFNTAFTKGGATCAVNTVTDLTGVPVHHVAVVDFKGFEKIVDTLGGLPVCLKYPFNDELAHVNLPAGPQTLTGREALGVARARYTLGDGSDLSRTARQQQVVKALLRQARESGVTSDPQTLYDVLSATLNHVSVDKKLGSLPAMATVAWQSRNISATDVRTVTLPVIYRQDGATVTLDTEAAAPLFNAIINDISPAPVTGQPDPGSPTSAKKQKCEGLPKVG